MRQSYRRVVYVLAVCVLAILPAIANAQATTKKATKAKARPKTISSSEAKLPEAVKKTFDEKFPNAMIEQATPEKEGGVMVYDIEFRDGRKHKETDIAEDGKMLESTEQVAQKSLPKEAMKAIKKAAEGGKINRTEKVTILYEIKDGKWAKVEKSKTQYEANVTKGEQSSDIIVDEKGKMIEEPKWASEKKPSEKATKEKKASAEK